MDSDSIPLLENINNDTYTKLVCLLNENCTWKKLADYFEIFSESEIQAMTRNQPAERLLFELNIKLCTVDILCDALRDCHMYDILTLFKEYEPIHIVDQTNFECNNNSQMVVRGQQITLTARAMGIPPPTYQWYFNGTILKEETAPTLTLWNFDLGCEGEYYCLIRQERSNILSSNPVILTLAPERPVIIRQPCAQEVCSIGSRVTLFVVAKGHPQLSYQWFKGNQQLDGCVQQTLTVDIKDENQDGKYRCYIYNSAGEVWSKESTITVYTTPQPEASAKVALLIANQLYDNLNKLFTPENDVKTLADLLQDLGFLVMSLQNLNLIEMRNAIKTFAELLPPDAYVVFYFAGHGFEIQDKFMLPVDTPGPEDYLQSNAICERELLKAILSTNPKLFLPLLDMCLKPPSVKNKKIFQKATDLYEYKANNNLIQGYSTTSYLGAYEKKTARNGLYVEHLKKYLIQNKDMPIVEILQRVAKDVASVCMQQKPFFGTNVTLDYRLTDHCESNILVEEKFKALSKVPDDIVLKYKEAGVESKVTFLPYKNIFLNTLEVRFTNLKDFKASFEATGEELSFELTRDHDVLVIKVMNIQKLVTNKTITLSLSKNGELVDCTVWDIGKPMIAAADLWWSPNRNQQHDNDKS